MLVASRSVFPFALLLLFLSSQLLSADTEALPSFLDRIGKQVEAFWEGISSVSCMESVAQAKLAPTGKVVSHQKAAFQYLLILQLSGDELTVEESREMQGKAAKRTTQPLLVTGGFSVLALIFHPYFQSSYTFRELPSTDDSVRLISFEHVRGARSPSALELRGRDYPLEWQGMAWIDRRTAAVRRIQTSTGAAEEDLGLKKLTADVRYEAVEFQKPRTVFWLPQSAAIEAETRKQHWRNVHEFTGYKRFSVTTDVIVGDPKEK